MIPQAFPVHTNRRPNPRIARLWSPAMGAVLLLTTAGCGDKAPKKEAEETPHLALPVKIVTVAPRDFERRFVVQGTLESKYYAHVAARVGGNLDAIWVDDGDRVEAGKTRLFQIDPVALSNAVSAAEQNLAVSRAGLAVSRASVEKTEAEFQKTERDYQRYRRLHEKGTVSDDEYETHETACTASRAALSLVRSQVELAAAQAAQCEAALRIAHKAFQDSLIVAPVSGVVSHRASEPGEQIAPGQVILHIDDPSVVKASAFLPAQFYGEVDENKTVFKLSADGKMIGTYPVCYRSPTVDTTLRTFEVKGLVKNNPSAVPGNMADFTFVFETRKGLAVPDASLLERLDRFVVFVEKDGKVHMTDVKAGLRNDGWTEILEGLHEGDRVLSEGQSQATDDIEVSVH